MPSSSSGKIIQLARQLLDLARDRPVEVLGDAALLERKIAEAEQVERLVERLLRVVVAFQQVLGGQAAVGLLQVDERLLGVRRRLRRHVGVAHAGDAQHVEDQHAVIGGDGAAALRDDGGVRHAHLVAHVLHVVDDVVGVFLQRVIDARFEIRLRAVVIDAQAAAHVQVLAARRRRAPGPRRRARLRSPRP